MKPPAQAAVSLAVYCALSVAWTWPLALDPLGFDPSRQMDGPNTLGMAAAAARVDATARSFQLAWPEGQSLVRGDSFVFFALARALAGLPAALPVALVTLLGPPLSAWAAERLAARLGAAFPWTLLAGLAYGFSGLAATAILEGYAFNVLNPWLPLAAAATLDATAPGGRPRDGLLAAGWWALALATTAYAGVGATLLVGGLLAGAWLRRERPPVAPTVALAGGVLALGGLYTAVFLAAPEDARRALPDTETTAVMMATGSSRLATLLWRTPSVDVGLHSQGALLGSAALALALYAPWARPPGERPAGVRRLLVLSALLALLSLGPSLRAYATDQGIPWLLRPLADLGGGAFFRFPERLMLPVTAAVGAVGALTLTAIARARPKAAALLLGAAVVDVLVGAGLPLREGHLPWAVPSAYAAAPEGRAVLDLWPRFVGPSSGDNLRLSRRMVGYGALHGRPILTDGLNVSPGEDRRRPIADWVEMAAVGGVVDGAEARARLDALGIGAIAVHLSLYPPTAAERLTAALTGLLGPPAALTHDGGETVALWVVAEGPPPGTVEDRVAAWTALHAEAR